MDNLRALQEKNPHLPIASVRSEAFLPYGQWLSAFDAASLMQACLETTQLPAEGSAYIASLPLLEALPAAKQLQRTCFGQLEIQCGVCHGQNSQMNALEYHKSSEINIAVTDMVLLLADQREIDAGGHLDAARVKAFYLQAGEVVELYATTLHFCPCQVGPNFRCLVVLPAGTNTPLEASEKAGERLLWARNKWLLAHEKNQKLLQRGAFAGIYGENWTVFPATTG